MALLKLCEFSGHFFGLHALECLLRNVDVLGFRHAAYTEGVWKGWVRRLASSTAINWMLSLAFGISKLRSVSDAHNSRLCGRLRPFLDRGLTPTILLGPSPSTCIHQHSLHGYWPIISCIKSHLKFQILNLPRCFGLLLALRQCWQCQRCRLGNSRIHGGRIRRQDVSFDGAGPLTHRRGINRRIDATPFLSVQPADWYRSGDVERAAQRASA